MTEQYQPGQPGQPNNGGAERPGRVALNLHSFESTRSRSRQGRLSRGQSQIAPAGRSGREIFRRRSRRRTDALRPHMCVHLLLAAMNLKI